MKLWVILENGTERELENIKVFSYSTRGVSQKKLYTIDNYGYSLNIENVEAIEVEAE